MIINGGTNKTIQSKTNDNEPTHFTENTASVIDLIFVRNKSNILTSRVTDWFLPNQIRYHCPVLVLLKFLRPSTKTFKRKMYNYHQADFDRYRTLLSESDLENEIERNSNIDDNVQYLAAAILRASEESVPNKTVTIRPNDHPWITCHIKNLIRKRKRMYRKYRKPSNIDFLVKLKTLRNRVVNEIRKSKQEQFDKLEHLLNNEQSNSKLFWKTSKQILNLDKHSAALPTINMNNEYAETSIQKANMLNNYFATQVAIDDSNKSLPRPVNVQHENLATITITIKDVSDVLENLNITKASGPDLISPRLLKEGAPVLSKSMSKPFNRSLQQGYIPSSWKDADITPIHKKEDKSSPSNYRPISLLSTVGKTMERCVHKHLFNNISRNNLLTPFQSGFIPGDSTTNQLLHIYHTFCEDRRQRVVIGGIVSDWLLFLPCPSRLYSRTATLFSLYK